jgi:cytochrome c oxidase subunit 3/cytochrome o ubiquinol oxidase subunit 3
VRETTDVSESHITAETPQAGERIIAPGAELASHLRPPSIASGTVLTPSQWGMIAFLLSEVAFFSTLIVTYVVFVGADALPNGMGGPTPASTLSLGLVIVTTICLLSSSVTVHLAEKALHRDHEGGFRLWWSMTILLGIAFLAGTAYEWYELIYHRGLTVSRNLFGSTYYTLVGFHGLHVTAGVIALLIVLGLALRRQVTSRHAIGVELVSWYWHFVDGVWVVVFVVVYLWSGKAT